MTKQEHEALYRKVCQNNEEAVECLTKLGSLVRLCDDVWDADKPLDKELVERVFSDMVFELGRNSFYVEHRKEIEAMMFISWNAWMDSNEWAISPDRAKQMCAWFIRDWCNEIVMLFAWLIGGREHVRSLSLEVRESFLHELLEKENGHIR